MVTLLADQFCGWCFKRHLLGCYLEKVSWEKSLSSGNANSMLLIWELGSSKWVWMYLSILVMQLHVILGRGGRSCLLSGHFKEM